MFVKKKFSIALLAVAYVSISTLTLAQEHQESGIPSFGSFSGEDINRIVKPEPALSASTDEQFGYTLKSSKQYIDIVNSFSDGGTPSFVVTGKDISGDTVSINEGDIWVEDSEGDIVPTSFETMEQAKAPVLVTVLMDMSGSMSGYEKHVTNITNSLFERLPKHIKCQAITFGGDHKVYGSPESPCATVKVKNLKASGKTPVFGAIENTLEKSRHLSGVQQLMLVITDGEPTDKPSGNLKTHSDIAHIVFFWVGTSDGSVAEVQFKFIADKFIEQNGDPFLALAQHVENLDNQIRNQVVVHTHVNQN